MSLRKDSGCSGCLRLKGVCRPRHIQKDATAFPELYNTMSTQTRGSMTEHKRFS